MNSTSYIFLSLVEIFPPRTLIENAFSAAINEIPHLAHYGCRGTREEAVRTLMDIYLDTQPVECPAGSCLALSINIPP